MTKKILSGVPEVHLWRKTHTLGRVWCASVASVREHCVLLLTVRCEGGEPALLTLDLAFKHKRDPRYTRTTGSGGGRRTQTLLTYGTVRSDFPPLRIVS